MHKSYLQNGENKLYNKNIRRPILILIIMSWLNLKIRMNVEDGFYDFDENFLKFWKTN